ncbi:MAG TPA: MarR family transcriptional regulator [Phycisphaerae bacterium]|nr:MarR family transcriptional regulator [Phycisphaerae bacterium]
MQQLRKETISRISPDACAHELLTGVPTVMRFIRCQMRGHRRAELSVPQFRALVFLSHNEDTSMSAMASHLGLSLPATSRLAEVLVQRGLMERRARSSDRRCVSLSLTARGWATYRAALRATQTAIAHRCDALTMEELSMVTQAMGILNRVFSSESCRAEAMP